MRAGLHYPNFLSLTRGFSQNFHVHLSKAAASALLSNFMLEAAILCKKSAHKQSLKADSALDTYYGSVYRDRCLLLVDCKWDIAMITHSKQS